MMAKRQLPEKLKKAASSQKLARNHATEKHVAISRRAAKIAHIRGQRDAGTLAAELFQVAQALVLFEFPYQPLLFRA